MNISTAGGGGKARWWQIAVQPQRWQATVGQLPSPNPLLQPPPVPVRVATLLAQLLTLLQV
jgi:hypothetical protein